MDLIRPYTLLKDGTQARTVFSGYMELPDSIEGTTINADFIASIFNSSRIGGSRKRGYGIVKAEVVIQQTNYNGYAEIGIDTPRGTLFTADTAFSSDDKVVGEIKLLSNREYDAVSGSGQHFSPPELVWSVGSMVLE